MTTELSRRAFLASLAGAFLAACSPGDARQSSSTTPVTTTSPPLPPDPTTSPPSIGATTTTAATPTTQGPLEAPATPLPNDPFTLGVASGDPTARSVILWTRLAPDPLGGGGMPADSIAVVWELATGPDFARLVKTGIAEAQPEYGHTLHVDVSGLVADTRYWYRFRTGEYTSPPGRTRTLPTSGAATESFSFAFSSCQRYEDAHFSAWRQIAELDLGIVIFLGDYIYETTPRKKPVPGRGFEAEEVSDVTGYRNRYARYKLDAHLQAAHAAHPFVPVWDDHEVFNNYGPLDGDPVAEARRAAGYQVWWEHMPVRLPPPTGATFAIHRTIQVGDLLQLWLLDARQYRSREPDCGDTLDDPVLADAPLVVACDDVLSSERTMLGAQQLQWLLAGLRASTATWNALAQQVLMASTGSVEALPGPLALTDKWGGYQSERAQILETMAATATPNSIVLSGDFHAAGVGRLGIPASAEPIAVEFMAPPIGSRFSRRYATLADVVQGFPDVEYLEPFRGFATCTVTPARWVTDFWRVADTADPASAVTRDSTWVAEAGVPGVARG